MVIRMNKMFFFMFAVLLLALAGCNSSTEEANSYNFPDYVYNAKHPGAVAAYQYAVDAEEGILEHIPCYCNCYIDPFNHNNVKDCFISNTESTNDLVVYDDHGAGWGICIEIALDVQKLHEQGVSLVDIRNYIDESYSKFAEPTPTPHPHGH